MGKSFNVAVKVAVPPLLEETLVVVGTCYTRSNTIVGEIGF